MIRFVLLAVGALLTGCTCCPQPHLNTGGPHDFSGTPVDDHMAALIGEKGKIQTEDNVLLHIRDDEPKADFWVLFGPNPGTKGPALGGRHNSRTTFTVADGYALYWGLWPIGTDGTEDTSADGTTFVIQCQGKIHRSFLLKNPTGRPVHVNLTGGDPRKGKTMTEKGHYIEVLFDQAGRPSLSDAKETDANPETRDFIAAVKKAAIANGFPPSELE